MTLAEIYFDYSRVTDQANELERIAKSLERQADPNLDEICGSLKNAWDSDNSAQYMKKLCKVQGDVRTTSENLYKIADVIRKIAKQIRDAELEAWRIVNENKES